MKLPVIQRFQKQDYADSPNWFNRFIQDINQFCETVWNALNKNLTIADNMDAQIYSTSIRAGVAAVNNAFSFVSQLKHTPQAILVGQVVDSVAYSTPLTSAVGVTWNFSTPNINITGIAGLTNGRTYNLTLVII